MKGENGICQLNKVFEQSKSKHLLMKAWQAARRF